MVNKKMMELGKQGSAIRKLFEYGKKRKKVIGEENVFDFSIGNPSVPTPKKVNKILIDLIKNKNSIDLHGYTSSTGSLEVRNAIANYVNQTFNCHEDGMHIFLTMGAAAGIVSSIQGLLNEGEEVIVLAPFWPEYQVFIEKANGKTIIVDCLKDSFMPDIETLNEAINEKTKMVIINSPNNPTGVVYDEKVIQNIASILNKKQEEYHHSIYLLSDEPYRDLIYSNKKYPFISCYYDNSIIIYSFSKSLSLPGERIGYVIVGSNCQNRDDVFASIVGAARSIGYVCASSLFQYLIPSCLGLTVDLEIYKKNRDILYNKLKEIGYQTIYPEGAFYLFVKTLEDDDEHFSEIAKEFELLLVPSSSFGIKGYVRISYCVETKQIEKSISAFKKLYDYYTRSQING